MKNLLLLLRNVYFKSFAHKISAMELGDEIRTGLLSYVLVSFLVVMFVFFSHLFHYLNSIFFIGPILVTKFFSLAMMAVWWLAFFSSMSSVYRHFYFKKDIPLLLSLPISQKEFFVLKFLHVYKDTIISSCLVLIPILAAFGLSYNAGISFYIQSLVGLIPFYLTATLCAILLVVLVSSVFPAARSRRVVWFLIGFGLIVFYVVGRFMIEPIRFITYSDYGKNNEVMAIEWLSGFLSISSMSKSSVSYFPSGLYSGFLIDSLSNTAHYGVISWQWFSSKKFLYLIIYVLTLLWLGMLVMKRYYLLSFIIKDDNREVNYVSKNFFAFLMRKIKRYIPGDIYYALAEIDIKSFLRNPSQWSQLMIGTGLVVVYVISMWHALSTSYSGMLYLKIAVLLWGAFLVCVIAAALALRFIFSDIASNFSQEIKTLEYLPLNGKDIIDEKFFMRVCGITGVAGSTGAVALGGSLLRSFFLSSVNSNEASLMPYEGVLIFLMIFLSVTLTLAIGSFAFSKGIAKMKREVFNNKDIESSPESSAQGLLFSVASLVYIMVNFSILAVSLRSYYFAVISSGITKLFVMYKIIFFVIILSIVNIVMSYFFYRKSVYDFSRLS